MRSAWGARGRFLLAAAASLSVAVAHAATAPKLVGTLEGHAAGVAAVAFAPDGKTLASGGGYRDGTVRLWDVATGKTLLALPGDAGISVGAVAYSPDGSLLAIGRSDQTVRLVEPGSGKLVRTLAGVQGGINGVAFSPSGKYLVGACDADEAAASWQVATSTLTRRRTLRWGAHAVAFSPGARTLAIGARFGSLALSRAGKGGVTRALITIRTGGKITVAFSPDGSLLASGGHAGQVYLWDAQKWAVVRKLKGCGLVPPLAFSPDGALLATGSSEATVKLWNPSTGTLEHTLAGHRSAVSSLAITRDGRLLASGSTDRIIKLWEMATAAK